MNYTTARDYFFRFQWRAAQNTYVQRTKCNVSTFITLIEDTPQKLFPKNLQATMFQKFQAGERLRLFFKPQACFVKHENIDQPFDRQM